VAGDFRRLIRSLSRVSYPAVPIGLHAGATFSDVAAAAARLPCDGTIGRHHLEDLAMPTATGHTAVIRAKKVIGTSVKNAAGDKIGTVEDIVLDKLSNNIVYAVVGFGGFLGMNEKFHPLPWSALDYDEVENSYVVSFTKEQLQAAPSDSIEALTKADGVSGYQQRVTDYYRKH
jgi:sporulation protein YlmC with PRC-barrel domain